MDREQRPDTEDKADASNFQRHDSFRKVLPSTPSATADSRLSMSMRMIEIPETNEVDRCKRAYAPYFLEYALLSEFQVFQKNEIPGLYISPADKDPLVWFGVLFIHSGIYNGGIFRFRIHFPPTFPNGPCPAIIFENEICHPAINEETGELNVAAEFPEWKTGVNNVWKVLQYAKSVFFNVETENPLSKEAARLLLENPEEFKIRAQSCALTSRANLFLPPKDDDANYIIFEPSTEEDIDTSIQLDAQ